MEISKCSNIRTPSCLRVSYHHLPEQHCFKITGQLIASCWLYLPIFYKSNYKGTKKGGKCMFKKLATLMTFEGTCFCPIIPSNIQMFLNIDMHVDVFLV